MIAARAEVTVRYAETDMMGIVYHANYLPWFEVARTQLLREQGFPYRQLEADGFRIPVLEVSAKYRRPALYDDTLTIVATLREKPLLRIRIDRHGRDHLRRVDYVPVFISEDDFAVLPVARILRQHADAAEPIQLSWQRTVGTIGRGRTYGPWSRPLP